MMRVLITAGPTRERWDAVRFISNRSSGRVGLAIARAAVQAGYQVRLLFGPAGTVEPPRNCLIQRFESCADLQQLLEKHFEWCDWLIMAAAVSDYRPVQPVEGKLAREAGNRLVLELERTPDLVRLMAARKRPDQRIVAFALEEPGHLIERAAEKLRQKNVDVMIANPLSTMEADSIDARILFPDGRCEAPGNMSKEAFGQWLVEQLAVWFETSESRSRETRSRQD